MCWSSKFARALQRNRGGQGRGACRPAAKVQLGHYSQSRSSQRKQQRSSVRYWGLSPGAGSSPVLLNDSGDPEEAEVCDHHFIGVVENVLRLQVLVHDAFGVQVSHSLEDKQQRFTECTLTSVALWLSSVVDASCGCRARFKLERTCLQARQQIKMKHIPKPVINRVIFNVFGVPFNRKKQNSKTFPARGWNESLWVFSDEILKIY